MGCRTGWSCHTNPCANVEDATVWKSNPDASCPSDTGSGPARSSPSGLGVIGVLIGFAGRSPVASAACNSRAGPPPTPTVPTARPELAAVAAGSCGLEVGAVIRSRDGSRAESVGADVDGVGGGARACVECRLIL